jgi:hypothetical protein
MSTNKLQRRRRLPLLLHIFQHRLILVQLIVFLFVIHPFTVPATISSDIGQRRQRQQQPTDPIRRATTTTVKPRPKTCTEPQEEDGKKPNVEIQSSRSSSASLAIGILRRRPVECNVGVGIESLLEGRC